MSINCLFQFHTKVKFYWNYCKKIKINFKKTLKFNLMSGHCEKFKYKCTWMKFKMYYILVTKNQVQVLVNKIQTKLVLCASAKIECIPFQVHEHSTNLIYTHPVTRQKKTKNFKWSWLIKFEIQILWSEKKKLLISFYLREISSSVQVCSISSTSSWTSSIKVLFPNTL